MSTPTTTDHLTPTDTPGAIINTNPDHADIHRPAADHAATGQLPTSTSTADRTDHGGRPTHTGRTTPRRPRDTQRSWPAHDVVGGIQISMREARRRRRAALAADASEAGSITLPDAVRAHLREARSEYVITFDRWLMRFLPGTCHVREFDDILSRENVELCEKLDETMVKYPDPRAYALTRTYGRHAVLDWRRRERVQRCEGAIVEHDEDGTRTKGNVVDSFDSVVATDNGGPISLYELYAAETIDLDQMLETLVIDGIDRAALVDAVRAAAREVLSPDELRALEEVVIEGRLVVDAATDAGIARETMGRQRARAVAKLRRVFNPPR